MARAKKLGVAELQRAVESAPAISYRVSYQPTGGAGAKVYPSTYLGDNDEPTYASEVRLIDGKETKCVIVDSIPSQANRIEEAISDLRTNGGLTFPAISVDLTEHNRGIFSTLDLPHRIADAYLEHARLNGKPFTKSELYGDLKSATARNCRALYEADPMSLLMGFWFSRGNSSSIGRFSRMITSELIAVNAIAGRKTSSRLDPVRSDTSGETANKESLAASETGKTGEPKLSEIGFGNIPPSIETKGGVTCDHVLQIATITLSGLRRLSWGDNPEQDKAGRVVLAALGLVGLEALMTGGVWLRSGCDLYATKASRALVPNTNFNLDLKSAMDLFKKSVAAAKKKGLEFGDSTMLTGDSPLLADLLNGTKEKAEKKTKKKAAKKSAKKKSAKKKSSKKRARA